MGKKITWKKEKREAISSFPFKFEAVWKNIKWKKGERDGNFWDRKKI